jgi:hypothetical protein
MAKIAFPKHYAKRRPLISSNLDEVRKKCQRQQIENDSARSNGDVIFGHIRPLPAEIVIPSVSIIQKRRKFRNGRRCAKSVKWQQIGNHHRPIEWWRHFQHEMLPSGRNLDSVNFHYLPSKRARCTGNVNRQQSGKLYRSNCDVISSLFLFLVQNVQKSL